MGFFLLKSKKIIQCSCIQVIDVLSSCLGDGYNNYAKKIKIKIYIQCLPVHMLIENMLMFNEELLLLWIIKKKGNRMGENGGCFSTLDVYCT